MPYWLVSFRMTLSDLAKYWMTQALHCLSMTAAAELLVCFFWPCLLAALWENAYVLSSKYFGSDSRTVSCTEVLYFSVKLAGDGRVFASTIRRRKHSHHHSTAWRSATYITDLVSDQQHRLQEVCGSIAVASSVAWISLINSGIIIVLLAV